MFKSRKSGRLSRRMGRLIVLFAYPGFALLFIALATLFIGLFHTPAMEICTFCLHYSMPLLFITLFLLLFFPCPWCGKPQIAPRSVRILKQIEYDNLIGTFPAKWKSPDGGYCMWCDCLMRYDDVE